jgi:hypothetical protein
VASVFKFLLALQLLLAKPASIKVDLTHHPKFPLAFGELASGRFPHGFIFLDVIAMVS